MKRWVNANLWAYWWFLWSQHLWFCFSLDISNKQGNDLKMKLIVTFVIILTLVKSLNLGMNYRIQLSWHLMLKTLKISWKVKNMNSWDMLANFWIVCREFRLPLIMCKTCLMHSPLIFPVCLHNFSLYFIVKFLYSVLKGTLSFTANKEFGFKTYKEKRPPHRILWALYLVTWKHNW